MRLAHQGIALLVTFIWGTNFVLIKIGLDQLPPFLFATLRFALVAFPLLFFISRPAISWWSLASYGVLIGFGQFGLLFWAMQDHITPGLASLVVQMQVFFTILLAVYLFQERLKRIQILALIISAAGLGLIVWQTDGNTTLLGLCVVLVAALSWAAGNCIVKHVGGVNIIAFIVWSSLFAIWPLLLMSLYFEGAPLMLSSIKQASLSAWGIVLWQTVGNTLIGYGLWNMLLEKYHAAQVTPWALLVPVFGLAASSFYLGEPLQWWKIGATALILGGLLLNMLSSRRFFTAAPPL